MASADERLCDAALRGDLAGIAAALLAGADPNVVEGSYDETPLHRAAIYGRVAAIGALVAAGACVDRTDLNGWTPLMYAAQNGETAAIDALLAAGADVHRVNNAGKEGLTALHLASRWGRLGAARMLVKAGARTDVRNDEGKRSIDVVRVLTCTLDAAARWCHAAVPVRRAQVCKHSDKSNEAALRALFASAAPWSRRRPVAIGCYAVEWEWEA
jgi:ankyrin repeat protein